MIESMKVTKKEVSTAEAEVTIDEERSKTLMFCAVTVQTCGV